MYDAYAYLPWLLAVAYFNVITKILALQKISQNPFIVKPPTTPYQKDHDLPSSPTIV